MGAAVSAVSTFALGEMTFEAAVCTDPSTGHEEIWVYRTDILRDLVATGQPDALKLTPKYKAWGDELAVLEQAVMDSLDGAAA
jgi:hypothetical protein